MRWTKELGHGFATPMVYELADDHCVHGRLVVSERPDGARAVVLLLQLAEPVGPGSFPTGVDSRRVLRDGTQLLLGDLDHDGSHVSAIAVHPDGLFAHVTVTSAHSRNISGWPTTVTWPDNGPDTPAPLTLDEVAAIAQDVAAAAASP